MAARKKKMKTEEYTVVLVKPDGVRKRVIGNVVSRFERVGLTLRAAKFIWVDKIHAGKHYQDKNSYHKTVGIKTLENYEKYGLDPLESLGTKDPVKIGKLMRKWNMDFISSGPVFAMIWEGPGAISLVRKMVGNTFPYDASPGTIRGDYSLDSSFNANVNRRPAQNIVHASGNEQEAVFERKLWFKEKEIYKY